MIGKNVCTNPDVTALIKKQPNTPKLPTLNKTSPKYYIIIKIISR